MDKKALLLSAQKLQQVSEKTANEYFEKMEQFVAKQNKTLLARNDIGTLIGENNEQMMRDNHANHCRFIASVLKFYNPQILVETVLWVFRAYRSHGFSTNYWAAQLNSWITILPEFLSSESWNEIYPYYEWMQVNIPVFAKITDSTIDKKKM